MAYPKLGLYQAVVTDNSEFYKRGHIRVRVSHFYSGNIDWDLSVNYNEDKFKEELSKDIKCLVYTPFGGGSGHGMFTLPQINSIGIVSFLDGNSNKAIWLGSFINPKFDTDGTFLSANVPNDDIAEEGYDTDGINKDGKNIDVEGGALIIRQKTTGGEKPDGLDWNKSRTENLIVLSEDKLKLTHASKWDEADDKNSAEINRYQEISIEKGTDEGSVTYGQTIISVKSFIIGEDDDDKLEEFGLEIIGKDVSLKTRSSNKIDNTIKLTDDSITLTSFNNDNDNETEISQTPTELLLKTKDSTINMYKDEVNIFGKNKVTLSGEDIRVGGIAEGYVVTSDRPFSFRMEDGTILTSSHKTKA